MFFELFTQAVYPSYSGMKQNGDMRFDFPEVENYPGIKEIQQGIMDFCRRYFITFQKDSFALEISGYDAYCPFRMCIRDLKLIKNCFSEYTFARFVGGDLRNQRIETISELLEQEGV